MSRRPPALTLLVTLGLVTLAFGGTLLASPARAYGERAFQSNTVIGPGDPYYPVYARTTLAQSFTVTADYILTNVTLRVRNDGGNLNSLLVSIHPNDPNGPGPLMSTELANSSWVTPNNASAPINWSFPLYPAVTLHAGSVYWIVAENDAAKAPPADGYEWHESGADTYAGGLGFALNTTTGLWTGLPYDLYFVTYGREQAANVSLAMTADRTDAQPLDPVTFTLDFNNTGTDTATWVWLNTTLPSALVNLTVTYPDLQPLSAAAFPNLTFQDVPSGPHAFLVSAQVDIGTAPGTVVTASASLDFLDANGIETRGRQADAAVIVGLVTKQLYLGSTSVATKLLTTLAPRAATPASSTLNPGAPQPIQFLLAPRLARPFLAVNGSASLWVSSQKLGTQTFRLNVSLLDNGTPVVSLYPSFTITAPVFHLMTLSFGQLGHTFPSASQIGLSLWSYGGGGGSTDNLIVRYNGTAYPSHLDLTTSTYIDVTRLSLQNPTTNGTIWSPRDPVAVLANVSDPFGASRVDGVWINITSPLGVRVAAGPMSLVMTDLSALPAWSLFSYTLSPPLLTGTYRIDILAMEDNGVVDRARALAYVAEPDFGFADVTSVGRALASGSFAYYLYYNNTGNGAAGGVWINETLPMEVAYVGSSLPPSSSVGNRYSWNLTNVSVGDHVLEINVSVLSTSTEPAWVRDNASLAYTDGSGHFEETLAASAVVFLNGPILTVSLTASPTAGIHENETLIYTVSLENAGANSGTAWLNDTLPLGFTYLSDNAGLLGAVLTQDGPRLLYEFPGILANSNWTFQISVRAAANLLLNGTYTDVLDVNYTSTNGYLMPAERTSCSRISLDPLFIHGGITFLTPRASPGGLAALMVALENSGNEAASRVWLNLSLDLRLAVVDASRAAVYGPGYARFVLQAVAVGWTSIFLNVSLSPIALDGNELGVAGTLDAADLLGNPVLPLSFAPAFVFVTSASFRLSADPLDRAVEAGMLFPISIGTANIGSSDAANAWINATIPSSLEYVNDTADVAPAAAGLAYSWHWRSPSPVLRAGSVNAFTLNLRARSATPSGTAANITLHLEYEDSDLSSQPGMNVTIHAEIIAPTLVMSVEASQPNIVSGGTFNYTILVANRGLSVAHWVWVRDVLDPNVRLVSYASSGEATGNSTLNWTYTDLAPGAVETIELTVRAVDGLAPGIFITNSVEATYTNSAGFALGSLRSPPVTLRITQDLSPILWIGGIAAALGVLAFAIRFRRLHVDIEEAFLVYRDGVLISHLSRTLMREKDEDVLSGMLTAVQEFVREAFQYGEHRELHQLDFGEYRILIERGAFVYLAVVYSGNESVALRKKVRGVIDLIEKEYGKILAKWDGDMEEVVGAQELIRSTLLGTGNHVRNGSASPEYE